MGKYADQVNRSHGNLGPLAIREQKNQRSKSRSSERRAERRLRADEMTEGWRSQTPEEQLESLDLRLGKGVGAKKQRARLHTYIADRIAAHADAKTADKKRPKKKRSAKQS